MRSSLAPIPRINHIRVWRLIPVRRCRPDSRWCQVEASPRRVLPARGRWEIDHPRVACTIQRPDETYQIGGRSALPLSIMAGKKLTPAPPEWYAPDAYRPAEDLDAGDWLLNLTLRSWLHIDAQPQTEEALRRVGPVLRRGDKLQVKRMHLTDVHRWVHSFASSEWADPFGALEEACQRPSLPCDVWDALRTGKIRSSIEPLSVSALYIFEKMLPEEIRARGVRLQDGDHSATGPRAFGGRLDHAFSLQLVNRFVRIDLSLPDDVIRADLEKFLAVERRSLAEIGGQQPYREAARLELKAHDLGTLAKLGLLQFLDLDRWQRAQGLHLSPYAIREMAGIVDRSREPELQRRVKLTLDQLQLHAWFARIERGGGRSRRS